jgi:hypothetical protein
MSLKAAPLRSAMWFMDGDHPALSDLVPTLEESKEIAYALSRSGELLYCNAAWDTFANLNGGASCLRGQVRGTSIWQVIPRELVPFYEHGFRVARETGDWQHEFDCASPAESRTFRMRAVPLGDGDLLIVNSLLHAEAQRPATVDDLSRFRDEHGLFHLCSHCRKAQMVGTAQWHFVPVLLAEKRLRISHGLCPICTKYHYGKYLGRK